MALDTYGGLKTSVANFLNRSDLTADIPDFITLAHSDLNASVRHWRMVKRATATVSGQFLNVPSDWLEGLNIQISSDPVTPLGFASIQQMDQFRAQHPSAGKPCWFAIHGSQLEFVPVPDGNYTVEMTYYAELDTLSDDTDANWLLTRYPNAYLYGALLQAAPFLRDDERVMLWQALYEQVIQKINKESDYAATSAATPLARTRRAFG